MAAQSAMLCMTVTAAAAFHLHPTAKGSPYVLPSRSGTPHCALAEERLESGKAALIAGVGGSLAAAPVALIASDAFSAQWEFATDALAVQLFLFGVVYRYAVRSDDNPMLKQGATGAFAVTRTLASARVGEQCTALPLSCGPPLGYLDWDLIIQLSALFAESTVAFGAAALLLEVAFDKGWARRLPAAGLPEDD